MSHCDLYIRVDGNAEIGTGHVMRCLAIAHAVRKAGGDCTFIVADEKMRPLIAGQGFSCIVLDSVWSDLDWETGKMERLIREKGIRSLLVDSYFVTPDYLQRLHQLTHVTYIDDLNQFVYPCSALINYNIYADKWDYPSRYPDTQLLLGPRYAPLREEFQNLPRRTVREQVLDVLVTTGGSDPLNVAGSLVQRAKQTPKIAGLNYHIVAGRFNQHLPMLEELAQEHPGVFIHRNVQRMSELMLACDIAVSAGGSTLYELCACGTPTICFAWADNQLDGIAAFGEKYMISVGDVRMDGGSAIRKVTDAVVCLRRNWKMRESQAQLLSELSDGQGAMRLAHELIK